MIRMSSGRFMTRCGGQDARCRSSRRRSPRNPRYHCLGWKIRPRSKSSRSASSRPIRSTPALLLLLVGPGRDQRPLHLEVAVGRLDPENVPFRHEIFELGPTGQKVRVRNNPSRGESLNRQRLLEQGDPAASGIADDHDPRVRDDPCVPSWRGERGRGHGRPPGGASVPAHSETEMYRWVWPLYSSASRRSSAFKSTPVPLRPSSTSSET